MGRCTRDRRSWGWPDGECDRDHRRASRHHAGRTRSAEGRWLRAGDVRTLVVNRDAVRADSSLRVGAVVRLAVGATTEAWQLVGVVESMLGPIAYAPREALVAPGGRVSTVVVRSGLAGEASQLDLIQCLRSALADRGIGVASSSMIAESRRSTEDTC